MNSTLRIDFLAPAASEPAAVAERAAEPIDLVDEMRLRTWARRHFVPAARRDSAWHPVILDEMTGIDKELAF